MFQEVKRFLTTTDPLKIILCIILIVLIIIIVLLVIMNYQLYVERKQLLEERNVLRWEFQRLRRLEENASGIHDGGFIYFVKKAANILDVVSPFIKFFV